ncbi:MAG: F0F1 ATP synthase subunit A [Saccharofermentans sp.]|nr:F0F1 ATP synthase subunit A [Mageeibacillus sp.]MCI1263643.1 F0F1 ATP synthase subunit A [Saccharofermentans sp.]MCI1274732.1 F0F1 ATP synthase subunit A [Saccharofermentans sp.]MCI1769346.1 F0F1 ATP synthase subunit A [Mageeibacillus sp.]MCI2043655.1 F0F1 ATP synthase subunit A [Mageeibacillus sp.]
MGNIVLSIGSWLSEFLISFGKQFIEEFKIGDIGEDINKGILQWQHTFFNVGDIPIVLTDAIIVTWLAVAIVFVLFKSMVGKDTIKPNMKQTFLWMLVDLIVNSAMGFGMNRKEAEHVCPMIATLGLVIAGCNAISTFKIAPPAKNIAFPAALAIVSITYVVAVSIKFVGVKGFWASLTTPMKAMLPFKVLDFVIKPVSLALRLFGNVFGAFVFMEFLYIVVPVILPGAFGLWFDLADGLLQAIVFAYLTMSYIGEIVEVGHELQEHPERFTNKKSSKKHSADDVKSQETVAA